MSRGSGRRYCGVCNARLKQDVSDCPHCGQFCAQRPGEHTSSADPAETDDTKNSSWLERMGSWVLGAIAVAIGSLMGKGGPAPHPPRLPVPARVVAPRMPAPALSPKRAPAVNLAPAAQAFQQQRQREEQEERLRQSMLPGF